MNCSNLIKISFLSKIQGYSKNPCFEQIREREKTKFYLISHKKSKNLS